LKLKEVVDEEDAKETMELYNAILVKFQKSVKYSESPKDLAYKKGVEIIERFKKLSGVSLEEIFKIICQEDEQLAYYFGYGQKSLKMRDNAKVREVYDLLINNSNIIKISEKPVVLKFLCDTCDTCDQKTESNTKENNEKINDRVPKSRSHVSHVSHSEDSDSEKKDFMGINHLNKVKDQQEQQQQQQQ
jgi:hypothetical protein